MMIMLIGGLVVVLSALGYVVYRNICTFVTPKRRALKQLPSDVGIHNWEDVSFFAADGVQLKGWFVTSKRSDQATILLIHGLESNRADMLRQAACFSKQGYGLVLFDLRCHGESGGAYATLGALEQQDVEAAFHYAAARADVNEAAIGIVAHSMGAAASLAAAKRLPALRFMVIQSLYANLADNLRHALKFRMGVAASVLLPLLAVVFRGLTGVSVWAIRPVDDLAELAQLPILFMHGQEDAFILPLNSDALFKEAQGPKQQILIPKARHRCVLKRRFDYVEADLNAFVKQYFSQPLAAKSSPKPKPQYVKEENYETRYARA